MTLSELRTLVHTTALPAFLYEAPHGVNDYIVLQPYGIGGMHGDDTIALTAARVQVDVFSQQSGFRSQFQTVLNTLAGSPDIFVGFPDIGWDADTRSQRMVVTVGLL